MITPASTEDAYAECLAMRPVIDAAVAEVAAMDRWAALRDEPYPAQVAAFKALTAAFEARLAAVRRWVRKHPEVADDGPGLFGEGSG